MCPIPTYPTTPITTEIAVTARKPVIILVPSFNSLNISFLLFSAIKFVIGIRISGGIRKIIRKTVCKAQPLDGLLHAFGHVNQFGFHPSETNALHPDGEELQSAHV